MGGPTSLAEKHIFSLKYFFLWKKVVSLQHSMIKERYNVDIARCLNDSRPGRHVAMGMNADATTLIKLMDIGTPTNISKNQ